MTMKATAQKWGNSLGLRIPKGLADELGITFGSTLEIVKRGDALVVRAGKKTGRKYRLDDLVDGMTTKNRHAETPTGSTRGREAW